MTNAAAAIEQLTPKPGQSWIGMREAERRHCTRPDGKTTVGMIHGWIKAGKIPPQALGPEVGKGKPRLIDEYYVWKAAREWNPYKADRTTPEIIVESATGAPSVYPAQVIRANQLLTELPAPPSPTGTVATASLVGSFLAPFRSAHARNELATATLYQWTRYTNLWAEHAPLFPWDALTYVTYFEKIEAKSRGNGHRRVLRSFVKWLREIYPSALIPSVPSSRSSKRSRRPIVLTDVEADAIIERLAETDYPNAAALCRTVTLCGARPWELTDRAWSEVTPAGTYSPGHAKKPEGPIHFPPGLYEELAMIPRPSDGPLFPNDDHTGTRYPGRKRTMSGQRLTAMDVWRAMDRATRDLGIDMTHRSNGAYAFRHLFAERNKRLMPLSQLAAIMRTSVKMLSDVYGLHDDADNAAALHRAHAERLANRR